MSTSIPGTADDEEMKQFDALMTTLIRMTAEQDGQKLTPQEVEDSLAKFKLSAEEYDALPMHSQAHHVHRTIAVFRALNDMDTVGKLRDQGVLEHAQAEGIIKELEQAALIENAKLPRPHEPTLLQDPAIERWRTMRDSIHKGFRFTRYNTGPAIYYAALVPLSVFAIAYFTRDQWSWGGRYRGESMKRSGSEAPPKQ
ncbi:hypothetical protein DACRYDRAFT_20157 [Dacryopinax primogenitus]|uniref:NADH-ubiquinone oxidoreductase B15 subunit n=1 Tax=Dacryopinax primogenitus (strain DJM 731) TaxID=1858805 RepID=M5GGN0_DACPD|nr:uncharacterized protein DACRYDRAFT_20157 [Dacryopinax primogenitus]EJU05773.1 hypothetical protein DACRYDRAFT_20157 [Dacryopinax primogenitus]